MNKMPLIVLTFLMLLVVISGVVDSGDLQEYPDERKDYGNILYKSSFGIEDHSHEDHFLVGPRLSTSDETTFLEDNIQKSEDMVERLSKLVTGLKGEGQDVSELEPAINDYSQFVSKARTYLIQAENASSEAEREQYLKLARESIIHANSELKPIFDRVKAYLPDPVIISENSILVASGSGMAILSGDIDVDFFLSDGRFTVVDFTGDMLIDMEHEFKQEYMPEKGPGDDILVPHKIFSYANVTGNISVSGSTFTVAMMADDIDLLVTGAGEAEFIGNGTFYFDNGTAGNENKWVKPIFESD